MALLSSDAAQAVPERRKGTERVAGQPVGHTAAAGGAGDDVSRGGDSLARMDAGEGRRGNRCAAVGFAEPLPPPLPSQPVAARCGSPADPGDGCAVARSPGGLLDADMATEAEVVAALQAGPLLCVLCESATPASQAAFAAALLALHEDSGRGGLPAAPRPLPRLGLARGPSPAAAALRALCRLGPAGGCGLGAPAAPPALPAVPSDGGGPPAAAAPPAGLLPPASSDDGGAVVASTPPPPPPSFFLSRGSLLLPRPGPGPGPPPPGGATRAPLLAPIASSDPCCARGGDAAAAEAWPAGRRLAAAAAAARDEGLDPVVAVLVDAAAGGGGGGPAFAARAMDVQPLRLPARLISRISAGRLSAGTSPTRSSPGRSPGARSAAAGPSAFGGGRAAGAARSVSPDRGGRAAAAAGFCSAGVLGGSSGDFGGFAAGGGGAGSPRNSSVDGRRGSSSCCTAAAGGGGGGGAAEDAEAQLRAFLVDWAQGKQGLMQALYIA